MKNSNLSDEYVQLDKIVKSYNQNSLKQSLFFANYSKSQFPKLNNIPIFHNIIGLINLRLKDWEESISNFETAIKLKPDFFEGYYNLGLAFFDIGNLEKAYKIALKRKVIQNKVDHIIV